MFKKFLVVLMVVLIVVFLGIYERTYKRNAIVTNSSNGIVTVKDNCGYVWEYRGTATIGDSVTLVMHDNHTDSNIKDDIIKEVK